MRKAFYLFFVALAGIVSCNKEIVTEPEPAQDGELVKFSITGVLDKELTKTAYDADGKMTWCDGDKAALIVYKGEGYSNQNRNQYTLEAQYNDISVDGRTAVFYGMIDAHLNTSDWLSSGFAVYPAEPVTQINPSNYYNAPYIKVPSSGSMLGLASSIILVGTPNSDVSNFNFKTAMAVLKVNITNIPAEAQAIRLSTSNSDSYPVDGDFTLVKSGDVVTVGLGNYQGWGNGYQSVDISSEGAIAGRDFFFNIPVGTYPANTLSFEVLGANDQVLMKRTISKSLTLERGECLAIPSLLYHRVWVNGSPSHPKLYTVKPSGANTIRASISTEKLTSANYVSTYWKNGNRFGNATTDAYDLTGLTNNSGASYFSTAGIYYLQYIVSSDGTIPTSLSDASVLTYGSVPFFYAPAANKIPVASSWLNVPYVSTAEGSVANLVDGSTSNYWHSPYGSEDPARNATYGQIISIDLNEGGLTTDGNFYFTFATRNAMNDHAKTMDVYVSNVRWDDASFDGSKVKVGSTSNALDGIFPYSDLWIKNPIDCSGSGSYRYITISILECDGLTKGLFDLRTSGCVHMAEIEFYTK